MIQPQQIPNGLLINMNIFLSHTKIIDTNCEKIINDSNNCGEFAEIIKESWNLSDIPIISNIVCHQKSVKKNTVEIVMEKKLIFKMIH